MLCVCDCNVCLHKVLQRCYNEVVVALIDLNFIFMLYCYHSVFAPLIVSCFIFCL